MAYRHRPWAPYVPVAKRRATAVKQSKRIEKKGQKLQPVELTGRAIANSFWGKAWCENLESYSDLANRIPRGRTYIRSGCVVHLEINPGIVSSLVSGSYLYEVNIKIAKLTGARWRDLKAACSGSIGSLVELLQGTLSKEVMELVCSKQRGLFPAPREIDMDCSCPDSAEMCKHIAAVLYGVGARLDSQPELLFTLRQVDHTELIEVAASDFGQDLLTAGAAVSGEITGDLSELFGVELAPEPETVKTTQPKRRASLGKTRPTKEAQPTIKRTGTRSNVKRPAKKSPT